MTAELESQASDFAERILDLLSGCFAGPHEISAETRGDRVVIECEVPLSVGREVLGTLSVRFRCQLDSRGSWLAIQDSAFKLVSSIERRPIIRFEYLRDQTGGHPSAHIQVHAERGALSHLLSKAQHATPHEVSGLHLPVGGARFRPSLEDVIQFLVAECGFDAKKNWERSVLMHRSEWRRTQLRAAVRDLPSDAAEVLQTLGYEMTAPPDPPAESERMLTAW